MTAQVFQYLLYNGLETGMAANPLNNYFKTLKEIPNFISRFSCNMNKYNAAWEIKENKLYLIEFSAYLSFNPTVEVDIEYLFPGQKEVFAEWYSGTIRVPQGEVLKAVHHGYETVFERDLMWIFRSK